jgi:hypothetical protein
MPEYMLRTLQLYCTDNKVHSETNFYGMYCSESEANESVWGDLRCAGMSVGMQK